MYKSACIVITLTAFVSLGCAVAYAQAPAPEETVSAKDLGVAEPTLLPSSPLYFVKDWKRGLQRLFTFDPIRKAELELKFTDEKAAEAKGLAEQQPQRTEALERAVKNYRSSQERLKLRFQTLRQTPQNPRIDRLLEKLADRTVKHEKLFARLAQKFDQKKELRVEIESSTGVLRDVLQSTKSFIEEDLKERQREQLEAEFKKKQSDLERCGPMPLRPPPLGCGGPVCKDAKWEYVCPQDQKQQRETKCVVGGCSGELCLPAGSPPLASPCVYQPEFACYKNARCEVQSDGKCDWTPSKELQLCIERERGRSPEPPPPTSDPAAQFRCALKGGAWKDGRCMTSAPPPPEADTTLPFECALRGGTIKEGRCIISTPPPSSPAQSDAARQFECALKGGAWKDNQCVFSASAVPAKIPLQEVKVEADDNGFYPAAAITVAKGSKVKLTFVVRSVSVYFGGLDFRSSKFKTDPVKPGGSATAEFTADESFTITSYWPASGVKKADLRIEAQ